MKNSIFLSALLVILLSAGFSTQASAQCYYRRDYYGNRVRYCQPAVRVYAAPVVIGGGGYYGGYRVNYYGGPRHYGGYHGGGYHGGYHNYGHGGYGHGGGHFHHR